MVANNRDGVALLGRSRDVPLRHDRASHGPLIRRSCASRRCGLSPDLAGAPRLPPSDELPALARSPDTGRATVVASHNEAVAAKLWVSSCAAGMRIGYALVDTGGLTRLAALRRCQPELTSLVLGAALMLLIAAI